MIYIKVFKKILRAYLFEQIEYQGMVYHTWRKVDLFHQKIILMKYFKRAKELLIDRAYRKPWRGWLSSGW